MKYDLAIVGGGIIGLSIAFESARNGWKVCVVDQPLVEPQTSWAAAGILPATNLQTAVEPMDRLRGLSDQLHCRWSEELKDICGINNELRRTGTMYFARTPGEVAALIGQESIWRDEEISFLDCDARQIDELFPKVQPRISSRQILKATFVPGEKSLRNSRHLLALKKSVAKMGADFIEVASRPQVSCVHRIASLAVDRTRLNADRICIAAGCWTQSILQSFDVAIRTIPIRGQIVLYKIPKPVFDRTIYEGGLYLVPRIDGHVIAGSTVEDVGFDINTTDAALMHLKGFAQDWFLELNDAAVVKTWAGLRPATHDGFPYIGRIPHCQNGFVATGHFRSGIHLSTGTAAVLFELMTEQPLSVDLAQFDPHRG